MNLSALKYSELISYLDLTSTNPAIRILLEKIENPNGPLIDELIDAGMDPNYMTFDDHYSPGEYIQSLESRVSDYDWQIDELQDKVDALEDKLEQNKVKTVLEWCELVREQMGEKDDQIYKLTRELNQAKTEIEQVKEKMKVWGALTRDVPNEEKRS